MTQQSPARLAGLDETQCETFRRDGFLHPVDVMPETEAKALRAQIEALEARKHGRLSGLTRAKPHLLLPYLWDVVHDARILDKVSSLLGPDIICPLGRICRLASGCDVLGADRKPGCHGLACPE